MGKQQVNTGRGNQTINTNNVWDRIVSLETNGVPKADMDGIKIRVDGVESSLAQKLPQVSVTEFGATPDSLVDQTPFIQSAIDYIISIGGGTLWFPKGTYRIIADETTNTNPYNPKRVEIRGYVTGSEGPPDTRVVHFVENVHIKGDRAVIKMEGMTEDRLRSIDDIAMSNVDVFTAFSFAYAKNCSVSGIRFEGDYKTEGVSFRYSSGVSQARAKAIGFFGSQNCEVYGCQFEGILGNFVHVNTAGRDLDGYWMPSSNMTIRDNKMNLCFEIGINLTTLTKGCRVFNNTITHANGCGIEGPALITNNTIQDCYGGGISPSWDAVVSNNVIDNVNDGIILSGTADITNNQHINTTVTDNIIKNTKRVALTVYPGSGNLIFKGNRIINTNLQNVDGNTLIMMVNLTSVADNLIRNLKIIDNQFEVNNASCLTNYGIVAQNFKDCEISGNTFRKLDSITFVRDIYYVNAVNCIIKDNSITTGISHDSTLTERNKVSNNFYSASTTPLVTEWLTDTPPTGGSWKVGDTLTRKSPIITNNSNGTSTFNLGWVCTATSPLTWKLYTITTGTTDKNILSKTGVSAFNSDGSVTKTIAHGLGVTPNFFIVQKGSANVPAIDYVTADATNLTIGFVSAPTNGAYIALRWKAEI